MAGGAGAYHRRKKRNENDYQQLSHPPHSSQPSSSSAAPASTASVKDLKGKLYVTDEAQDVEEEISMKLIFKIMVAVRVSGALWTGISDCDEVYNYWEPLHLLMTNEGFQTWEYSPVYALRSYFYIYLHLFPAKIIQALLPFFSKVGVFFGMRLVLAFFAAAVEFYLYKTLNRRVGTAIARNYVICSMISPGLYHASVAFLPSTFSMQMNALAVATWFDHRWYLSVLFTAISALVGWPFAAVLGLPIVLEMLLVRREVLRFTWYALLAGVKVLLLLVMTDSYYYGKFVLAPLNIVLYNVFSSHGPDLYGVEPWTYYVKNLLLNWNLLVLLAPLALPLSALVYVRVFPRREFSLRYWRRFLPVVFITASACLWLLIFFKQPHKEERFLFPIYPLIAILSAIALDALTRCGSYFGHKFSKKMAYFAGGVMAVSIVLFLMRAGALYRGYSASIEAYGHLNYVFNKPHEKESIDFSKMDQADPVRVCVGKEWYRFPSSFFIPDYIADKNKKRKVELHFVQSAFKGILPKPYERGTVPEITRAIPSEMNDQNLEEPSRYVPIESCNYLIDLEIPDITEMEPNFAKMDKQFQSIYEKSFILPHRSHWLFRAFYVPYFSEVKNEYGTYHVLERL
ncbi:hypothetical protein QR680_006370 [Steinernema hermaphroditum]|uniref:Mannosyltransferase n=1 Tax=Steinernema hermaphroditum TaxID=289476 RepID=A0AA39HWG4_9BILA|nr:hypothetical protein QR680_006370 [Steinernema hermaphroditum]